MCFKKAPGAVRNKKKSKKQEREGQQSLIDFCNTFLLQQIHSNRAQDKKLAKSQLLSQAAPGVTCEMQMVPNCLHCIHTVM